MIDSWEEWDDVEFLIQRPFGHHGGLIHSQTITVPISCLPTTSLMRTTCNHA